MESGDLNQLWDCQVSAPTLLGEVRAWAGAPGPNGPMPPSSDSGPHQAKGSPAHTHRQYSGPTAPPTPHSHLSVFALPPSKGPKCSFEGLRNPPLMGSLGLGWGVELLQAEPLGREGAQSWTGRPRSGRKRGRGYWEKILLPEPLWVTQTIKDSQHTAFQS